MNTSTLLLVSRKTNGRCFYCNATDNLEVDHFISRQKHVEWGLEEVLGSVDREENLFLACRTCNRTKNAKPPEDFIGNSFETWTRYARANRRAGIFTEKDVAAMFDTYRLENDFRVGWAEVMRCVENPNLLQEFLDSTVKLSWTEVIKES